MTIFFDPIVSYGFAGRIRPMNGVTPFTYRDGITFLRVLEELIAYVNQSLVSDLNVQIEDIVAQMNVSIEAMETHIVDNEDTYNNLLMSFMNEVDLRISAINEKTGPAGIQRIFLNSDYDLAVSDTWPGNHPIMFQVMQDSVGNHNLLMFSRNLSEYPIPVIGNSNVWNSLNSALYTTTLDIGGGARDGTNALVVGRTSNPASPNTIAALTNVGGERISVQHNRIHTVSVRVHADRECRIKFRINQVDEDDSPVDTFIESPYIANTNVDEWERVAFTFTTVNNSDLDAVSVDLWVDLPDGTSGPATNAYTSITDFQIETGSIVTNITGPIANPNGYEINHDPYSLSEFTLIPEPSGSWRLDDLSSLVYTVKADLENQMDSVRSDVSDDIDALRSDVSDDIDAFGNVLSNAIGTLNNTVDEISDDLDTKVNRNELVANVLDYGAVGDGVNNDSTAINAALATNDTVYIPAGTYLISSPIRLPSNTRVYGDGPSTVLLRDENSPGDMTLVCTDNYVTTGVPHSNYIENVEISHMTLDGNTWNMPAGVKGQEGHGEGSNLTISTSRYVYIHDLISKDADRHCIDIMGSHYAQNENPNYIMAGRSTDITIERVQTYSPRRDDGITTHDSKNVVIRDCYSEYESNHTMVNSYSNGIEIDDGSENVTVERCHVKGWNAGIQIQGHEGNMPARNVNIVDCVSEACTRSFYASAPNYDAVSPNQHFATDISFVRCTSLNRTDVAFSLNNNRDFSVYGYRRIRVEDFKCIGGANRPNAFLVFGSQCDNVYVDGVAFIDVGSSSPPIERGYISVDSAYGIGTNESGQAPILTIKNVYLDPNCPNPVYPLVRISNTSANYEIENVVGPVSGHMVEVQYLTAGSVLRNVYSATNATPVNVLLGGQSGTISSRVAYARAIQAALDLL